MRETKNSKVPFAILSCFTIAFILQGVLKLCGVFIFEKALNWEIFTIIDNSKILSTIYFSIYIFITIYCLSFVLTSNPYSKKWYHYVIFVVASFGSATLKIYANAMLTNVAVDILFDLALYVGIPLLTYFTTPRKDRLFNKNTLRNILLVITMQILLYFLYLGLNYWSTILNTIIPSTQYLASASSAILVQLEVYIGLVSLMLTMNMLIRNFIKEGNMWEPINIATEEAKEKELAKRKAKNVKKNGK